MVQYRPLGVLISKLQSLLRIGVAPDGKRNIHTFKLDFDTTERAVGIAKRMGYTWELSPEGKPDVMIAALSGITLSDDVALFREAGVSCVSLGETLIKSSNHKQITAEHIEEQNLLSGLLHSVTFLFFRSFI